MKTLVIIPTYNERPNIIELVPQILAQVPEVEILVVDDSSPDGTAQVVREMQDIWPQLHLLVRPQKQGLGRAYLAGMAWGLERDFDALVEMDADFSHRPEDLLTIVSALKNPDIDFVVGSRYVTGGGIQQWSIWRYLISRLGSFYSRWVLGYPLCDWTGGFNGWKKFVIERIGLQKIVSDGYCFQIELKYRALENNFRWQEVPILFDNRSFGKSKMSFKIFFEAFYKIWMIRNA